MSGNKNPRSSPPILKPKSQLAFVLAAETKVLEVGDIVPALIGEKAFGLCLLPTDWTLPFICVSADFFREYEENTDPNIVSRWAPLIAEALRKNSFRPEDRVLIRSSARNEGLFERGRFYSIEGLVSDLRPGLESCLSKLHSDQDTKGVSVPLIVQKLCDVAARGHLSNERRCYKEARDWMGEVESNTSSPLFPFQINLRNWRKDLTDYDVPMGPLRCSLQALISRGLEVPAQWAYIHGARIHFEWVWDGKRIFLVQADQEIKGVGVDPTKGIASMPKRLGSKTLKKYG